MEAHKIYFNKDKLKRSLSSKLNNLKKNSGTDSNIV